MNESEATTTAAQDGWEWAIIEIMGHRRHAGRVREEERFGSKMLRIDVPNQGNPADHGWQTMYYGGTAIFSFALTDEATAMQMNRPYEPPSRMRLAPPGPSNDEESDDDDEGPF